MARTKRFGTHCHFRGMLTGALLALLLTLPGFAAERSIHECTLEPVRDGFFHQVLLNRQSEVNFKREPDFAGHDLVRGVIPTGPELRDVMGFVADETERKLYIDTNQNLDLTDDAVSSANDRLTRQGMIFEDVLLQVPRDGGSDLYVVDFLFGEHGVPSVTVRSGWKGAISIGGAQYELGIIDNLDGELNQADSLIVRPIGPSREAIGSTSEMALPDFLSLGQQGFGLKLTLEPGVEYREILAKLSQSTKGMGTILLKGKFIEQLVLQGDKTLTLDDPGSSIQVPVGRYSVTEVHLQDDFTCRPYNSITSLVVNEKRPAELKLGGPLKHEVGAYRFANTLNLSYKLQGIGGEEYTNIVRGLGNAPTFAVYKGDKRRWAPAPSNMGEAAPARTHGEYLPSYSVTYQSSAVRTLA